MDIWEFFYHAFSKKGIGIMFIVLSVIETLSIKFYGISFYESVIMFVKANENIFLTSLLSFIAFLCVFACLYIIYSKKHKQRHGPVHGFIIIPVLFSAVFIMFLSVIFFIILINFLENFVFQRILGIYGKSVISLIIGVAWLVFVRFYWKKIL